MSLTCLSHTKNCSVRDALLWGICQSHLHQVRIQSRLDSRIAHLVLAILEAPPITGQIISLIELKIVQAFKRPEPTSSIPRISPVRVQEKADDICRIWPKDLHLLGLTEAQKSTVDGHVRDAFRALNKGGSIDFKAKRLQYTDGSTAVDIALPITVTILKNKEDKGFRVLLFPKTIFASGGERKIRWVYDVTAGAFLLKKRIVGVFEEQLLKFLLPLRRARGIQASVIWRTSEDKLQKPKLQIIEPVRNGTLSTLLGTAPLASLCMKQELIVDLLHDLKDLHSGRLSNVTVIPPRGLSKKVSYDTFHSDIKPLNVLVFFQNEKWRAELCDFGEAAACPDKYIISTGYTPPEYIKFYKKLRPFGIQDDRFDNTFEIVDFNIKHGQGRDVWSMGLVLLALLMEREEEVVWKSFFDQCYKKTKICPLPCLKAALSGCVSGHYAEENVLNIKQETIKADLDRLEKEVAAKHPEERAEVATLFQLVQGMLKIDPKERNTVAQCLDLVQPLTKG
jgi:hypothetical protein